MAQATQTHLDDNTGSGTSVTTDSISPKANQIVIVYVATFNSSTTPNTPTLTGCNITWNHIVTAQTTQRKVDLYVGISSNPTTGAITINYSGQNNSVGWSVDQFTNTKITNGGLDAIVQSNTNASTSVNGNFAVSLNPFAKATNATYGGLQLSANTAATGSNFTTIVSNSTNRLVEWAANNQTSVNWNVTGTVLACAAAIEIAFQLASGLIGDI